MIGQIANFSHTMGVVIDVSSVVISVLVFLIVGVDEVRGWRKGK